MKIIQPRLSKAQYRFFASSLRTISEGIILGSSAAFFLPEALQLQHTISLTKYALLSLTGWTFLMVGAIFENRGVKKI